MNDSTSNFHAPRQPEAAQGPHTIPSQNTDDLPWFCGKSDRGKVRENNEDQFSLDAERNLFIVADGMGGHAAGEVASLLAVEALQRLLTPQVIAAAAISSRLDEKMADALRQANAAVIKASENHLEWSGMGSTAVVALLHGHTLTIANVGDSRAYLLRSGALQMISQDHSVAAVLAEQNHISRDEIRIHPLRNRLTVCLGIEERIEPYTNRTLLQRGDRVLLCSDGLWDMLSDQEIARLWGEHPDAEESVQALIAAANLAGGKDNVTVVVLNIGDLDSFSISSNEFMESSDSSLDDTVVFAC